MSRRSAIAALVTCAAGLALTPWSCAAPTQITLELAGEPDCAALREVGVWVGEQAAGATGDPRFPAFQPCAHGFAGANVGSLVLTPREGDRPVVVTVRAAVDGDLASCATAPKGCVEARRRLRFVPHTPLRLPIVLSTACRGVDCADPNLTCDRGQCVPIDTVCADGTCAPPADAGTPPPIVDAGGDGAVDAGPCDTVVLAQTADPEFAVTVGASNRLALVRRTPPDMTFRCFDRSGATVASCPESTLSWTGGSAAIEIGGFAYSGQSYAVLGHHTVRSELSFLRMDGMGMGEFQLQDFGAPSRGVPSIGAWFGYFIPTSDPSITLKTVATGPGDNTVVDHPLSPVAAQDVEAAAVGQTFILSEKITACELHRYDANGDVLPGYRTTPGCTSAHVGSDGTSVAWATRTAGSVSIAVFDATLLQPIVAATQVTTSASGPFAVIAAPGGYRVLWSEGAAVRTRTLAVPSGTLSAASVVEPSAAAWHALSLPDPQYPWGFAWHDGAAIRWRRPCN